MLVLLLLMMLFFFVGCNDKPVDSNSPKSPREYRWTIDTVAYPGSLQTIMRSIWGSSPNDVYIVGHNDRGYGQMFHFNGSSWTPVSLNFGAIDLEDVYGFSSNNVWAVGAKLFINSDSVLFPNRYIIDSSLIIHFDGLKWNEIKLGRGRSLRTLWGNNPNDIWFGGDNGILFHFNGMKVSEDSIPQYPFHYGNSKYGYYSSTGNFNNEVYMMIFISNGSLPPTTVIFKKGNTNIWENVPHNYTSGPSRIWKHPSGNIVGTGRQVKINESNTWRTIFSVDSIFTTALSGIDGNNLFLIGFSNYSRLLSHIFHFNGTNWLRFDNLLLSYVIPHDILVFQNEVFIVCETYSFPAKTIILHGK